MSKLALFLILFFAGYTIFWVTFFQTTDNSNAQNIPSGIPSLRNISMPLNTVLSLQTSANKPLETYTIPILLRKQVFNLSCEFAAASAILFHFTNDPTFSVANEESAEKTLMTKIGISQNPNIGIRMGVDSDNNFSKLLQNLNQRFGGTEYYGVHAPPFIDVFAEYGLQAKPIYVTDAVVEKIKKAIRDNHLIMAWTYVGYGQAVDVLLSYGSTSIVRGEHSVVVNGFDKDGVFVMDPGTGTNRHVPFGVFIDSVKKFSMPLLEISKAPAIQEGTQPEIIDTTTGLKRNALSIMVVNGTTKVGAATELFSILKDFGYNVVLVKNAESFDYDDLTVVITKEKRDYLKLLLKDLSLAYYTVASSSANLLQDFAADVAITVGN